MRFKKSLILLSALLSIGLLNACSKQDNVKTITADTSAQTFTAPHEDIRLKFDTIKVASADSDFIGGSSLEELKSLFGEPVSSEDIPAGSVTLNSYKWSFDNITINVQLYKDSTIGRAISNFSFIRKETITKKEYNQLKDGISYSEAIKILGEPDDLSQVSSSDNETIQALWGSNIQSSASSANISLIFENKTLVKKTSSGLE